MYWMCSEPGEVHVSKSWRLWDGDIVIGGEGFAVDFADVEAAVVGDKVGDFVQLLVQMRTVAADDRDADNGELEAVLDGDLGGGYIEPAAQPLDEAFDNPPLALERIVAPQMNMNCQ
jgi:hypothetical protein